MKATASRIALAASLLLAAMICAFAPQFALADEPSPSQAETEASAEAPATNSVHVFEVATPESAEEEATEDDSWYQPTVPANPSTFAPLNFGTAAAGQDIMLGMFDSTGEGGTNNIFASYDGQNFTRIAQAYKTNDDTNKAYYENHWPQSCPSIMYYNGYFWALSGSNEWNHYTTPAKIWLGISYSKDLIHWTHAEFDGRLAPGSTKGVELETLPTVDMSKVRDKSFNYRNFDTVAPEWAVASNGSIYIVISCGYYGDYHGDHTNDQMQAYIIKVNELSAQDGVRDGNTNYLWSTNLKFRASKAKKLGINAAGTDFIDGALFTEGGADYLVIKKNGKSNQLYKTTNIDNVNSWRLVNSRMTFSYEGPSIAKLNGRYFLMTDRITNGRANGVRVTSTSNLEQSGAWPTPHDPSYTIMTGGSHPITKVRHGSVITLKAGTPEWNVANKILRGSNNTWQRLWGQSQYDTMKRVVQEGWANNSGGTVVIATSYSFADALSASSVAGKYKAPILVTEYNKLTQQTREELNRLKPSNIIIVGGKYVVTPAVEQQLKSLSYVKTVTRKAGNVASATAAELARSYFPKGTTDTAFLATSQGYHDALSASPIAYSKGYPIFLVDNYKSISQDTLKAMKDCGIKKIIIVGGKYVVHPDLEPKLKQNGITTIERKAGDKYWDTSYAVADWGIKTQGMKANNMGVATGFTYSDALCGGPLCGKSNAVLVLTEHNKARNTTIAKNNKSGIKTGYVFGGYYVVTKNVFDSFVSATK